MKKEKEKIYNQYYTEEKKDLGKFQPFPGPIIGEDQRHLAQARIPDSFKKLLLCAYYGLGLFQVLEIQHWTNENLYCHGICFLEERHNDISGGDKCFR